MGRSHRLVVLGGSKVGKTALIEQLIFGNHVVGVGGSCSKGDIYEVVLEIDKSVPEALQIFDTPGELFSDEPSHEGGLHEQEHFLSIADGVLIVYDITSKSSFELVNTIRTKLIGTRHRECPVVVVGNKRDLEGNRDVEVATVANWIQSSGVCAYETSVYDRESLREPFTHIAWSMANPGRAFPPHVTTQSFGGPQLRKSLTLPQSVKRPLALDEPLLQAANIRVCEESLSPEKPFPPTALPTLQKVETDSSSAVASSEVRSTSKGIDSPRLSFRSRSVETGSQHSVESRISGRLCPEDAEFPRGGLFGLTDCMSHHLKGDQLKS